MHGKSKARKILHTETHTRGASKNPLRRKRAGCESGKGRRVGTRLRRRRPKLAGNVGVHGIRAGDAACDEPIGRLPIRPCSLLI